MEIGNIETIYGHSKDHVLKSLNGNMKGGGGNTIFMVLLRPLISIEHYKLSYTKCGNEGGVELNTIQQFL